MSAIEPMLILSVAIAGFAVVSAPLMLFAYAAFIDVPYKSTYSVASCAALVTALTLIALGHLLYFHSGFEAFDSIYYRLGLFIAPSSFYFFGRWALFPTEPFRPILLVHLLPILLLFVRLDVALPALFLCGAAYSVWFGYLIYGLREQRKQFRFEFLYFSVMSVLAVAVLVLGFMLPRMDHAYFYYFYNLAVALGLAIMIVALVANPHLIGDLSEAARVRYGSSTLRDLDVDACLKKLNQLMTESKIYQSEDLSLASLAKDVGISGHQLSELINSRLGMGFSKYVRECRVAAAKALLISAPAQSILSVSMDTGFRSQSAFYAAFKEVTGQSPGDYRKAQLKSSLNASSIPG
jgi:AraC-like DNA-binding protein